MKKSNLCIKNKFLKLLLQVDKRVILDVLKKSIHDLLHSHELIDLVEIEDSIFTQNLCSSIEALFIHGQIKNQPSTFFGKLRRSKHCYDYDFWEFIKGYIPKNLLNVLENNSLKFTPVGLSRVWLRFALNECTILSYIESIRTDCKRLQQFYSKVSLIRDEEMMETFCGLLTSIEHIPFNLNTNSSLLNTWINSDALKLASIEVFINPKNENYEKNSLLDSQTSTTYDNRSLVLPNDEYEEILTTDIFHSSKRFSSSVPKIEPKKFSENNSLDEFDYKNVFSNYSTMPNDECCVVDLDKNIIEIKSNEDEISYSEERPEGGEPKEQIESQLENVPLHQNHEIQTQVYQKNISIHQELYNSELALDCDDLISKIDLNENSNSIDVSTSVNNDYKNNIQEIKEIDNNSNILLVEDINNEDTLVNSTESQLVQTNDSYDQLWTQPTLLPQRSVESIKVTEVEEEMMPNNVSVLQNECNTYTSDYLNQSKVFSSLIASKILTPTTDFVYNLFTRRYNFPIFSVKESDQSWELIGDDILAEKSEMKRLMDIFPGIDVSSTENGLNSVFGGLCSKCARPLESGIAMIDHYDGKLFCTICESGTKSIIPREVIYNWNFKPQTVSETTKRFLSEIMVHPNINLASQFRLCDVIPELARVRKLRQKLSLLWLQVTSCDIETATRIRETMFPREYMLSSTKENDLYSLEDLIILQSGILEKTLLFVINKIAIPHVKKCMTCRIKAMACDKCRDENRVIYIHEIDEYFECSTPLCSSVIHKTCKNASMTSFYCRRCVLYLQNQQPITLDRYDCAND